MRVLPSSLRRALNRRGVRTATSAPSAERDLTGVEPADRLILEQALPHSMTSVARMQALVDAVRYCVRRDVPGGFLECGVWRGGSVLAMILTLQELGVTDRDLHLFDTFDGMTAPTEHDVSPVDPPALETWREAQRLHMKPWAGYFDDEVFNEDTVREVVLSTGYPPSRVHFERGPVEDTLPGRAPERLALLRLDTDWYESTRHELRHLYPRLSSGGVLIVDDYGHWEGARRAVDEYFATEAAPLLLARSDYTGRMAVKA